jgi:hypothetical protein
VSTQTSKIALIKRRRKSKQDLHSGKQPLTAVLTEKKYKLAKKLLSYLKHNAISVFQLCHQLYMVQTGFMILPYKQLDIKNVSRSDKIRLNLLVKGAIWLQ